VTFQAAAEALADAAGELGHDCAATVAAAWAARVAPEACAGVTGAAVGLGAGQAELFQAADPLPSDADMRAAAEELAGGAWELLRRAADLEGEAQAGLAAARQCERDAARQEHGKGAEQAANAAAGARMAAADCECALEILDALTPRLKFALRRLEQAPDDLEEAYEVPYQHVRSGRSLPHSGDFLVPDSTTEGAA
jgi:hypothetical protein